MADIALFFTDSLRSSLLGTNREGQWMEQDMISAMEGIRILPLITLSMRELIGLLRGNLAAFCSKQHRYAGTAPATLQQLVLASAHCITSDVSVSWPRMGARSTRSNHSCILPHGQRSRNHAGNQRRQKPHRGIPWFQNPS